MVPTETIGLVIEKMRNTLSFAIGAAEAGACRRVASTQPIWPRRATMKVRPGRVPLSTSRRKASEARCSRTDESPSASGLASESDGVWGADECFAAVCGVMGFSLLLFWLDGRLVRVAGKSLS